MWGRHFEGTTFSKLAGWLAGCLARWKPASQAEPQLNTSSNMNFKKIWILQRGSRYTHNASLFQNYTNILCVSLQQLPFLSPQLSLYKETVYFQPTMRISKTLVQVLSPYRGLYRPSVNFRPTLRGFSYDCASFMSVPRFV